MRIRNNKLINFILEFSQIMLVFLGVYSALMCTASSLDMIYDGKLCLLLLFAASIVFLWTIYSAGDIPQGKTLRLNRHYDVLFWH